MESICNKCRQTFVADNEKELIHLEKQHHINSYTQYPTGWWHDCQGFWGLEEGLNDPIVIKSRFYAHNMLSVNEVTGPFPLPKD